MYIFSIFVGVSLLNILFASHFISIMFAGVVFTLFLKQIKKRNYYWLFWLMCTFAMIETNQGLKLFSLVLISLVMYIYIKPYIKQIVSSRDITNSFSIVIFYILLMSTYIFLNGFDISIVFTIILNIIIDIILVWLFL